jgi:hypothetical protein
VLNEGRLTHPRETTDLSMEDIGLMMGGMEAENVPA